MSNVFGNVSVKHHFWMLDPIQMLLKEYSASNKRNTLASTRYSPFLLRFSEKFTWPHFLSIGYKLFFNLFLVL